MAYSIKSEPLLPSMIAPTSATELMSNNERNKNVHGTSMLDWLATVIPNISQGDACILTPMLSIEIPAALRDWNN